MRIFLTGATGFLGAHLLRRLAVEDVSLMALVRPSSNLWRIDPIAKNARLVRGELGKPADWEEAFTAFKPQVVAHLAWSGVGNKHRNDSSQIDANVMPTVELARMSIRAGVEKFIGLGSQAEYGPLNKTITEEDSTRPTTLYGAAKLASCVLTEQLCRQAGLAWTWVRVFSTYGPMEDPDWMIPYLVQKLLTGEKPSLTACEQKWDYLYAPDAAEAIWTLIRSPEVSGIFNLGSGQVYTLRVIVEKIRDMINPRLPLGFGEVPYRADQVRLLHAEISRLKNVAAWNPATSLDQGLRETIEWHRGRLQVP